MLPTRVHAIVLVSKLHKPTLRALAFAKATRPNVLEAVYVGDRRRRPPTGCWRSGTSGNLDVPLKVLHSPYREVVRPIVEYAQEIRQRQPARRGRGLHPGVRRRPLVGAAAAQPDRAAAQGPAAVRARASWSSRCPTSCGRPRSPASARSATRRACTPATCAAAASTSTRDRPDRQDDRVSRRRPARARRAGARGSGSGSGRGRPGRPRRPLRRPAARAGVAGWSSSGTRCPGERVVVEITEGTDGDRFWRGDAVEVLTPSPDRVAAPCPVRRPRAAAAAATSSTSRVPAQRDLKAAVVREQLVRLGRLDRRPDWSRASRSRPVPGDDDGLRWRTRQRYVALPDGRRGMRKHRSHDVVPVDDCLIAHPDAREPDARPADHRDRRRAVTFAVAARRLLAGAPRRRRGAGRDRPRRPAAAAGGAGRSTSTPASGCSPRFLAEAGRRPAWSPSRATGPRAGTPAPTSPRHRAPSSSAARRPGAARRRTTSPSTSSSSTRRARAPSAPSWSRSSTAPRARSPTSPATPPRWPATSRSSPSTATGSTALRAFDLFPMTHHVECVALLEPRH